MKYRIHTFLAGQPSTTWRLIKELMDAWEQKLIQEQPATPLRSATLRFLEGLSSKDMETTLSKLLGGELTYKQAK